MSFSALLPALLLLVLVLILPLLLLKKTPWKLPPGPSRLPIIGNLHQLRDLSHHSLWELSKQYGPQMHLQLGYRPTLIVSSARIAKEVLQTHDFECCSRPPLVPYKKLSYNNLDVSFAPYGEVWREKRKICVLELFSTKKVQSFRSIMEEEVEKMIKAVSFSSLATVNLSEMLCSLSNTIICRAAFGSSYQGVAWKGNFREVLEEAQAMFAGFFFADFIPWMGWMDSVSGLNARLEKNFRELDAIYGQMIEEHLDAKRAVPEQEDLLDVLLRVQKDYNLTRDHIKGVLMNIFLAGTDTGSLTLVWAMSELIRNPRVMEKAQEEVRRIVGMKGNVEESDLKELQYLSYIIKETLRLHGPSPLLLPRETLQHCQIDGFDILPKTMVVINAYAIARDPNYWENPEEFWPERFADNSIDYKGQNFEYIPFGAGRRICPGMNFGILTVELALANLLYCYNWKLPPGLNKEDVDMSETPGISVLKKSPLLLVPTAYLC